MPERFVFEIAPSEPISALVYAAPADAPSVSLILGHGAGAGQNSAFMVKFAAALAERGIETITFNFAYTEAGRRVPDRNDRLEAAWRRMIAAYRSGEFGAHARRLAIGGKSMGGRIASQVAATEGESRPRGHRRAGVSRLSAASARAPGQAAIGAPAAASARRCCSSRARAILSAHRKSCDRSSRR